MLTCMRDWLYKVIVDSHFIFHYLMPYIERWYTTLLRLVRTPDHVTDDAGKTKLVVKWNGRTMPAFADSRYTALKNIRIRSDDVFLCGYPKTGCHWTYEILYMLTHGKAEVSRFGKMFEGMIEAMPDICLDSVPSPRVLNSHVLYDELCDGIKKNKTKIVLTIRCPKDTVVSFYHHTRNLKWLYDYEGNFDDYFKMFMAGKVDYGCYFENYLSWAKTMKEQKDNPIFFLEFEELKENPVQKVMELAEFLEISITKEFAEKVAEASSFLKLSQQRKGNPVYRKGVVGDWKNALSDDQAAQVDEAWREKMQGFKLPSGKNGYCSS